MFWVRQRFVAVRVPPSAVRLRWASAGCGVFFVEDSQDDLGAGDEAAVDQACVDVHDGHAEGDGAGHGGDAAEESFKALFAGEVFSSPPHSPLVGIVLK
jgi:hypothetical protein